MAVRQTSAAAYAEIKAEGLLSRMRLKVYECLYHNGPMTGSEANKIISAELGGRGYHKRISELVDQKVAMSVGERECSVTGRVALVWDVTANLPVDLKVEKQPFSKSSLKIMRALWKDATQEERQAITTVVNMAKKRLEKSP